MTHARSLSVLSVLLCLLGCAGNIESDVAGLDPERAGGIAVGLTDADCPPAVPAALAVPVGNKLAFAYDASGDQVYVCRATGWVLDHPDADLFKATSGTLIGSHYGGPTWEHLDGSLVRAARVAGASVDPTAVAWLLLGANAHEGEGRMENVSYIQRLNTVGGLAPTTGCDADHLGAFASVQYTATYYFFVPSSGNTGGNVCK